MRRDMTVPYINSAYDQNERGSGRRMILYGIMACKRTQSSSHIRCMGMAAG